MTTVRLPLPTAATSAVVSTAWSSVELTKVVVRDTPFHCTVEAGAKPVPVMVTVGAASLTYKDGATEVTTGAGLLIVKLVGADVPPPGTGFETVTWAVPDEAKSAADSATDNWVALT